MGVSAVVHHRLPGEDTAGRDTDGRGDELNAARGVLLACALCVPFWVGLYLLAF